jgi:hypothetical protein
MAAVVMARPRAARAVTGNAALDQTSPDRLGETAGSMSKKRSVWKNGPDGRTVRRNTLAEFWNSRPVELLQSPALRVLSRAAHLALIRIEIELRHHAGNLNGKLIVTKRQFVEFGIHHNTLAPALRELDALGLIRVTPGRGGNADHRQPNRFLLNYLCGAVDAHDEITNTWKRFKTMQEAEQIAASARAAKDPTKVAFGRRKATRRKTIFRAQKVQNPGPESGPETAQFPSPESGPPRQAQKVGPLSILSGGGGDGGGEFQSQSRAAAACVGCRPAAVNWRQLATAERPRTPTLLSLVRPRRGNGSV